MENNTYIIAAVLIPIIGACLLPLAGYISNRLRDLLAFAFIAAPFLLCLKMIPYVMGGGVVTVSVSFPMGFNFSLTADMLAVFMGAVSSFISALIVLYSFDYISHYRNQTEYYTMVTLFLGAMMGLVFSANLIFLYLFWEITAIASWRLIGFFRKEEDVLKADKAFLMTVFGALVMLLGFIGIYQLTGSFELSAAKTALQGKPLTDLIVVLVLFGIFSKSATLPFQTWLPDAGVAPSPVTALLHAAVLVKIGVYVYARLFVSTFSLPELWHTIVPGIAAASAIISACAALIDNNIKRIIAYSTISQIAFIFLGFSVGTGIGIAGALLFILTHGLAKGGLFLCAGIVEQRTKIKDITKLGGLMGSMPVTAVSFLLCSFSIMGIPPFGGFFSKFMVISGAINSGHGYIAGVFLFGSVLTILYLLRMYNAVFSGEAKLTGVEEGRGIMVWCVLAFGILSLLAGILMKYPFQFAQSALGQMVGI